MSETSDSPPATLRIQTAYESLGTPSANQDGQVRKENQISELLSRAMLQARDASSILKMCSRWRRKDPKAQAKLALNALERSANLIRQALGASEMGNPRREEG